jgi:hypothetical protein
MISPQTNLECLGKLGMLRYFPVRESVVAEIGKLLNEICPNDQGAKKLTAAVCEQCDEWPGPAKIREINNAVIASSRPAEVLPDGCENCRPHGYRRVFKVIERGTGAEQCFYPEGGVNSEWQMERQLSEQYRGSKTHDFYSSVVTPCSCALGRWRKAEMRKAAERRTAR